MSKKVGTVAIPKNRFPKVLGSGYVDRALEVVLTIGSGKKRLTWTRLEMSDQLRNVDYMAARDLVTPVLRSMGIDSVEMIWGTNPQRLWKRKASAAERKGLGNASMNVLMSLIKHVLHRNPYKWVAGESGDLVTLATLKNRERVIERKSKKRKKDRGV